MTSTKIQINLNTPNHNIQSCLGHLIIDIWNLFVICLLLFGALIQKCYTSPFCLFYTCVKLTGLRQAFYEFYQGIKKCIGIHSPPADHEIVTL